MTCLAHSCRPSDPGDTIRRLQIIHTCNFTDYIYHREQKLETMALYEQLNHKHRKLVASVVQNSPYLAITRSYFVKVTDTLYFCVLVNCFARGFYVLWLTAGLEEL